MMIEMGVPPAVSAATAAFMIMYPLQELCCASKLKAVCV